MIHQENSLVQHLTVYENIFLGHFEKKGLFVDKKAMMQASRELLDRLKISHISVTSYVKDLSASEKQLIEIAKALSQKTELIIMDEPTAALTVRETKILMDIIRELKRQNVAVVFISHHLEELFEIADVCSVLRDGEHIGTFSISEIDIPKLITLMVGRKLDSNVPARRRRRSRAGRRRRTTRSCSKPATSAAAERWKTPVSASTRARSSALPGWWVPAAPN